MRSSLLRAQRRSVVLDRSMEGVRMWDLDGLRDTTLGLDESQCTPSSRLLK